MRNNAPVLGLWLLLVSFPATGQERGSRQLIVPLAEGGFVGFKSETVVTNAAVTSSRLPVVKGAFDSQVLIDEDHLVHRVLVDHKGAIIFGYDLLVEPDLVSKIFKIAVKPLDARFEGRMLARRSDGSQRSEARHISTLPQSAEPQLLDDGDSLALDLLVNQNTGVKIIDIVKVAFDRATLWETNPKSIPRDFTLDAAEMAVNEYRLLINGEVLGVGKPASSQSGALLWFYVSERGRFILSLVPREGYRFQKVGFIDDNRIEFTINGDHYQWISSAPVLSAGGTWNLWVLHDPKYTPPINDLTASPKTKDKRGEIDAAADKIWDRANKIIPDPKPTIFSAVTGKSAPQSAGPVQLAPRRIRVITGGADRIENLWPKT